MEYKEVELLDGTLMRVKQVTYLAIQHVMGECPICQMPPIPVEEIPGKAGVTKAPARPGTPMYDEYEAKRRKVNDVRQRVERDAFLYIGVVDWKRPDDKEFHRQVPKKWQFPYDLTELGVEPYEKQLGEAGRRWDYIMFGLLTKNADISKVMDAIYTEDAEPLQEEEVQAIAEKFPGDAEQEADTGGSSEPLQ